jgi:surfactin synthase thioesterase subunit
VGISLSERQYTLDFDDAGAWALRRGFAPEELEVPVDVWSGTVDHLVTAAWERELAQRIPHTTHYLRPGGHFVAQLHFAELFETLLR